MIDDRDILAEFLHIAHLMTGENDDAPFADQFPDDVLQHLCIDRVQTGKRLI